MNARGQHPTDSAFRVCAYYRMSSDDQTTSIPQQEGDSREHAKRNGWEIVREYSDPGKSGLLPWNQRPGFKKMLEDCQRLRDVNAILVWHSSRFGRADALDSAQPKLLLRDLGMWLESVKEGRIDWNTSMGRMMDALITEQNNAYSHTLSYNVVRGHNHRAAQGWRTRGVAPFGYDRRYISPDGEQTLSIPRKRHFTAPAGWGLKLVINEEEAKWVRNIFDWYCGGKSLAWICRQLNAADVPTCYSHRLRKGKNRLFWGASSIHVILRNTAYIGLYIVGRQHSQRSLNRIEYQEVESIPPIISREQYELAQQLRSAKKSRKIKPRNTSGPLSGIMVCGCCGVPLYRRLMFSGTKNKRKVAYYSCKSHHENPKFRCRNWNVREDQVLPVIVQAVVGALDWETIAAMRIKPPTVDSGQIKRLHRQRAELETDIRRGTENLLRANQSTFPLLQRRLDEMQAELDRIINTIKLAEISEPEQERRARLDWLRSLKDRLVTLVGIETDDASPHPFEPSRRQREEIDALVGDNDGMFYLDGTPIRVTLNDPEQGQRTYWEYERMDYSFKAIQTDADQLRSLLLKLGVKAVCTWTPNDRVHFRLKRIEITGESVNQVIDTLDISTSSTPGPSPPASCWPPWSSWR